MSRQELESVATTLSEQWENVEILSGDTLESAYQSFLCYDIFHDLLTEYFGGECVVVYDKDKENILKLLCYLPKMPQTEALQKLAKEVNQTVGMRRHLEDFDEYNFFDASFLLGDYLRQKIIDIQEITKERMLDFTSYVMGSDSGFFLMSTGLPEKKKAASTPAKTTKVSKRVKVKGKGKKR